MKRAAGRCRHSLALWIHGGGARDDFQSPNCDFDAAPYLGSLYTTHKARTAFRRLLIEFCSLYLGSPLFHDLYTKNFNAFRTFNINIYCISNINTFIEFVKFWFGPGGFLMGFCGLHIHPRYPKRKICVLAGRFASGYTGEWLKAFPAGLIKELG